jgi:hypothetical protein
VTGLSTLVLAGQSVCPNAVGVASGQHSCDAAWAWHVALCVTELAGMMMPSDFGQRRMERHVRLALGRAQELAGSGPLTAGTVLQAAVDVGGSPAFRWLSKLLPLLPAREDGMASSPSAPPELPAVEFSPSLARSLEVAGPYLERGDQVVWGRDLVTIALLSRGDETLAEVATAGGTDLDTLRASWLEFVREGALHRPADEWSQWWVDAGFALPAPASVVTEISLSTSVRQVARQLASDSAGAGVTSFDIAQALAANHGHYAGRRLSPETFRAAPEDARRQEWDVWIKQIAQLLDPERLSGSQHEVLDGRLLMVGLGLVDRPLSRHLEEKELWGALLIEIDESVAVPGRELDIALRKVKLRHGYANDDAAGDDQLGVQGEVNALCEVLLDPDVAPPLAVGLFGKWGSGKSFFMESMRQQIAERAAKTDSVHRQNVVQIQFNAWHYSDGNLWASLAGEIFERLYDPEPTTPSDRAKWISARGDPKKVDRLQLLEKLETYEVLKQDLEEKASRLNEQKKALTKRHECLNAEHRIRINASSLANVASKLEQNQEVKAALTNIQEALGVRPAVQELSALAVTLRTTSGYLLAVWQRAKQKWLIAALSIVSLALALITLAIGIGASTWLGTRVAAVPAVASVTSILLTAKFLVPAANSVTEALGLIGAAAQTAADVEAQLVETRRKKEMILASEIRQYEQEMLEIAREQRDLDRRIATTNHEIGSLTVGRQLLDFLTERATGYQQQLGVIGMLHRDFRQLHAFMCELRDKRDQADAIAKDKKDDAIAKDKFNNDTDTTAEGKINKPIDRVVLYIDDLDRCSPDKVLEVLEAVHLILALPLFVVVVGVDPRWLERSLRHQYRHLALQDDPENDVYLQLMPLEYLEKIFQLPLTLPAMKDTGEEGSFGNLVQSLAPGTRPSHPAPSADETAKKTTPSGKGHSVGTTTPKRGPIEVQEGSQASGDIGNMLDLTTPEVEFAQRLGPLVTTPRAAKRLLNTYRFIRATQHVGSRSRFLGTDGRPGEYSALLTLLAVSAGYPSLADDFLLALERSDKDVSTWPALLEGLDPERPGQLTPTWLQEPSERPPTQAAVAGWSDLHRSLTAIEAGRDPASVPELEAYRTWGPIAARFSFKL